VKTIQMRVSPARSWLLAIAVAVLATTPAVSEAGSREKWGPFRGRVIDMENGKPIEGAVAVVVWWRSEWSPVQETRFFYDAREAVTGPDGTFEVPRLSVPLWHLGVRAGAVTVFAPGYEWDGTRVMPPSGHEFVDPTVIEMRRLKTREELLRKSRARPDGVPLEKLVEFTRAVNVESEMLGFKPLPIPTPETRSQ
jgi:hypothetical protein